MRAPRLAFACAAAMLGSVAVSTPSPETVEAQTAPAAPGLCRTNPAAAMRAALGHLPYGIVLGRTRIAALVRAHGGTRESLGADDAEWVDPAGNVEVRFRQGVAEGMTLTGRGPADWTPALGECLHGLSDWRTSYAEAARIFGVVGTEVRRPRMDVCYASGSAVGYGFDFASRVGDVVVELTQQDPVGCGDAYFAWTITRF